MKAHVGDWLVVHSHTDTRHEQKAEILRTGRDGAPPYSVRWIDDDRESLNVASLGYMGVVYCCGWCDA
jgi:Domain of unknown function (DUF1918)